MWREAWPSCRGARPAQFQIWDGQPRLWEVHRTASHCPPGASESRSVRCSLMRAKALLQPARLSLSVPQQLPRGLEQHSSDQLGQGRGRKSGKGLRVRCLSFCSHGCLSLCLSGSGKECKPSPSLCFASQPSLSSPACLRKGSPPGKSRGGERWTLHLESPSFQRFQVHTYQPAV